MKVLDIRFISFRALEARLMDFHCQFQLQRHKLGSNEGEETRNWALAGR